MTISYKNTIHKFKLLHVLEFNSKRKRMSVIVQDSKGQILLYCKGADSIIMKRMDPDKNPDLDATSRHLTVFADEGLRTLLVTYKIIPVDVYKSWAARYKVCYSLEFYSVGSFNS
jgi:P-type E1-E2 ATPase